MDDYYLSDFFHYENGVLFCENVAVTKIKTWLKNHGVGRVSPAFIYSESQIVTNVNMYLSAFKSLKRKARLNYAMKANMNPAVLRLVKALGCSVTLVSGFELELALKVGFAPKDLLLNGSGKELWEIELAIVSGCLLNIDSLFNAKQTISICRLLNKRAQVLLRLNPDIDPVSYV